VNEKKCAKIIEALNERLSCGRSTVLEESLVAHLLECMRCRRRAQLLDRVESLTAPGPEDAAPEQTVTAVRAYAAQLLPARPLVFAMRAVAGVAAAAAVLLVGIAVFLTVRGPMEPPGIGAPHVTPPGAGVSSAEETLPRGYALVVPADETNVSEVLNFAVRSADEGHVGPAVRSFVVERGKQGAVTYVPRFDDVQEYLRKRAGEPRYAVRTVDPTVVTVDF